MINLYLLCTDLKNQQSKARQKTNNIISEICTFLNTPSAETELLYSGWKQDFRYIYGDINTNLSSNNKLDANELLKSFNIQVSDSEDVPYKLKTLFFGIQTCFSLLIKTTMKSILGEMCDFSNISAEELITGAFAKRCGILNYGTTDWFCWPEYEIPNGFIKILNELEGIVEKYDNKSVTLIDFVDNNNYDYIKQMYEAIIPKELRHALGEYYTPDWLAEYTLSKAIKESNSSDIDALRILDPTCGSGTFLFKGIAFKRKRGATLNIILDTIQGFDINPLAILTAKTNYLLSIIDLLQPQNEIRIPIYNIDVLSVRAKEETHFSYDISSLTIQNPVDTIQENMLQDKISVASLPQFDIVVGNPPWVNWEYMSEEYRVKSQQLWLDYNLFSAKGRELSFSKEDISVLITYVVMDIFLKEAGILAFVIRQGVFKSAQNGVGFRKFYIRDECPVKALNVDDLSKIRVFENATNSTAIFITKKGEATTYPVPYYLWEKRDDIKKCSFGSYSQLQEVLGQVTITKQVAIPTIQSDKTSMWLTTDEKSISNITKVLGTNDYRARTGVFTGGANAVYWLEIKEEHDGKVLVSNIVERAKRKSEKIEKNIESRFVYPMVKGSNIKKWNVKYDMYLLCPHTKESKMWPVSGDELRNNYPQTFDYLLGFKDDLDGRKGFAGWEKEIQAQEFHAILRIGEYTFSKYKVAWKYIASEFICAVISTVDDKYLGNKLLIPNEKIMYVSTNDEGEAYYLCGVLSSTLIANCVESYMNPTCISAHVLNKLNIPAYDSKNDIHCSISKICMEGHGKKDLSPYIRRIDALVNQLYL